MEETCCSAFEESPVGPAALAAREDAIVVKAAAMAVMALWEEEDDEGSSCKSVAKFRGSNVPTNSLPYYRV